MHHHWLLDWSNSQARVAGDYEIAEAENKDALPGIARICGLPIDCTRALSVGKVGASSAPC